MLLGLDLGTTNVKALVADLQGRPLARGSCPVSLRHGGDDGVEQELKAIVDATWTAMREALAGVPASSVDAIGVSSQGGAMQLLNAAGQPMGPVISWMDGRGRPFDEALTRELGRPWFRDRIGHGGSGLAIGQWLRLGHEHPDWIAAGARIGFVGDLVVRELCGCAAQDATSAGLTLLHNPRCRQYDTEVLQRLGIKAHQLPALLRSDARAGGLRPEIAQATGLRPGIPVSPAIHDQYAAALGTGAVAPGVVMVGTGTAWVLLAVSEVLSPPVIDSAYAGNHVVEGLYGQILSLVNGGSALAWVLETTGSSGMGPQEVELLLGAAPAGSAGVCFWPFLASATAPGLAEGTHGRITGLRLSHRRPHLARAVVEGLVFELNRHLGLLRDRGGSVQRLVLGGGAASSQVTAQMIADVTGLELDCVSEGEVSLRGAVIVARHLAAPTKQVLDLALEMAAPSRRVFPGEARELYQALAREYEASLPRQEQGST